MQGLPQVLVTRPVPEAARWVQMLHDAGFAARALPLIEIAPVLDSAALAAARTRWRNYHALMFVSAAAVAHFWGSGWPLAESGNAVSTLPHCWATGPGTVRRLRELGVPDAVIDAPAPDAVQFDSEALWARVGPHLPAGASILIVRGGDAGGQARGRNWLTDTLRAAGARVDTAVAYRRLAPPLTAAAHELAVQATQCRFAVWLFSSAEAIANLLQLMPSVSWREGGAVVTHPRIAQVARDAGFGLVVTASPDPAALVASIKSLQ